MKHRDHFHCPTCAAKFDLEVELQHHERIRHLQQGVSGIEPSNEDPPPEKDESTRKNKEFTRRHME